jgi:dTDP-4-dehydrorhamnose reductase
VRTSAVFGGWDGTCLPTWDEVAAADEVLSPTYVPDLVQAALDLLVDGERGIWHLANAGAMTWSELLEHLGRPAPPPVRRLGHHAARARVLSSERGWLMPSLQDAIDRLRAQGQPDPSAGRRAGLDERAA